MMNRRRALLVISGATFGGVAGASSSVARPLPSTLFGEQAGASTTQAAAADKAADRAADKAADSQLREELARIATRADSEEGVPVFLACLNLVASDASHKAPPAALTALNASLAVEFRQTAAAWERVRPNPAASDVGHVIEVLAVRDFANGGKGPKS
jgi:hypothetical protein